MGGEEVKNIYFRKEEIAIQAAADLLEQLYASGTFIIEPRDGARQLLDALHHATDPCRFFGYMKDGSKVAIEFVDKGDRIPGYDEKKNRYEAFTSWWRLTFFKPRGPEGQHILENYIQVDRFKAEVTGDIDTCRWQYDRDALNSMDVDTDRELESVSAEEFRKVVLPIHRADYEKRTK